MYVIGKGRSARETYPDAPGGGRSSLLQTQSSNASNTPLPGLPASVDLCPPLTFVVPAGTKLILMASGWLGGNGGEDVDAADIVFQVDGVTVNTVGVDVRGTGSNSRVPWAMVWETPPLAAGSHVVNVKGSADADNVIGAQNNSLVVMATTA